MREISDIKKAIGSGKEVSDRVFVELLQHDQPAAIGLILKYFLNPPLAALWLNDAARAGSIEYLETPGSLYKDVLSDYANGIAVPGSLRTCFDVGGMALLMYVDKSEKPSFRWLRRGLVFPVQWRFDPLGGAHDCFLPRALRKIADLVKKTLQCEEPCFESEPSIRSNYEHWHLHFLEEFNVRRISPTTSVAEQSGNEHASFLDLVFPAGDSYSAFASLLVSLNVVANGGKSDLHCLATGCPNEENSQVIGIASVGKTLERKLDLAAWFSSFIGSTTEKPIRLFIPFNQIPEAEKLIEKKGSPWRSACLLDKSGLTQGSASLFDSVSDLRLASQVKPKPTDGLKPMQLWYSSLPDQDERSEFQASVINRSEQADHLIPSLQKAWGEISEHYGITEPLVCVSVLSRSWEWPLIDAAVFKCPCKLVFPNDLFLGGEVRTVPDENKSNIVFTRLSNAADENFTAVDLDILALKGLAAEERQQKVEETMKSVFTNPDGSIQDPGATYIVNRSSGSQFLSDSLVAAAPVGALIVSYWGRTDPLSNLPIPGELDLVVYRKILQDALERLSPLEKRREG